MPKEITKFLKTTIKNGDLVLVGDAPGIDRQVQDFLNKRKYDKVEIYGPGKEVRYYANPNWKTNPIDAPEYEPGSKEWLAKKDIAMTNRANKGYAVTITNGASATRKNVNRLLEQGKDVSVYELNGISKRKDRYVNPYKHEYDHLSNLTNELYDKRYWGKKLTDKETKTLEDGLKRLEFLDKLYDEWETKNNRS